MSQAEAVEMLNKFREGHLAEWVADIEKFLTPEEIVAVHAKVTQYRSADRIDSGVLLEVLKVAQEVKEFTGFSQGNAAHWYADGLQTLTDWDCRLDIGNRWSKDEKMTLQDLRDRMTAAIAEDAEDPMEGHPPFWDADTLAVAESWLATTPYALWQMVHEIEERAVSTVREGLFFAGAGRDREWTDPGPQIRSDWERAIKKWQKDWKRRQQAA